MPLVTPANQPPSYARIGPRQDLCAFCGTPPFGASALVHPWGWMHPDCKGQWDRQTSPAKAGFPWWGFIAAPVGALALVGLVAIGQQTKKSPSASAPLIATAPAYVGQLGAYTKNGQTWRVIQIKPGATKAEIMAVANRCVDMDSSAYFALVDDSSQAFDYIAWAERGAPFPEAWTKAHLIGLVMHKLGHPGLVFESAKPPFDITPL